MKNDWLESATAVLRDAAIKDCDNKRKFMLPIWTRADYYWNGIQDLFWDETISNWRTFDSERSNTEFDALRNANETINTYRAYGESIIAAATIGNLSIRYFPANADAAADIDKSYTYSDISDFIQRVNNVRDLRRQAFKIRWNQGLIGAYVSYVRDAKEYGHFDKPILGTESKMIVDRSCTDCGEQITHDELTTPEDYALDQGLEQEYSMTCPECGGTNITSSEHEEEVPYISGREQVPKGCSIIELFSPLQMRVPFYARTPAEINYVVVEGEVHYSTARRLYPKFADKIGPNHVEQTEAYDRSQADLYSQLSSYELVTIRRVWCDPSFYYVLHDRQEDFKKMNKEYPEGYLAHYVNDMLVEYKAESLHDRWSFVKSPLDTHIYCAPLGAPMIPVQNMENDLVYITMDTIRHGIGETFFDSRLIDSKTYNDHAQNPGSMVPVNLTFSNKPIQEHFAQLKSATLSREVDFFSKKLESAGQLVSGALPSIYGGAMQEGSKTLGVYEISRAQALQRITIPTNSIDDLMTEAVYKAVKLYDENMLGDENNVVYNEGQYQNVMLRKSVPEGKIGRVETVRSEQFPTTWEQKQAKVFELLSMGIEPINATIFSSENVNLMGRIIGIPELKVPGDVDRTKQLREIAELLKAQPIVDEFTGMETSSIPPEPDIDNSEVHISTIVSWANSIEGLRVKQQNSDGYKNVMLHLAEHKMQLAPEAPGQTPIETQPFPEEEVVQ